MTRKIDKRRKEELQRGKTNDRDETSTRAEEGATDRRRHGTDCHQRTLTAVSAAENRLSVYSAYNVYKSVYNHACSKTIELTASLSVG